MQAAARRGDHEASNAYDNAIGCVKSLLDVSHWDEPFLMGLSPITGQACIFICLQIHKKDSLPAALESISYVTLKILTKQLRTAFQYIHEGYSEGCTTPGFCNYKSFYNL